jgi:hypothetical protein
VKTHANARARVAPDGEVLKVDALQRDLLCAQIREFLAAAADSPGREAFVALQGAVEKMEVPPELAPRLDAVVELLLSSGRARQMYGPAAELALTALFQKTSRGKSIAASIHELNRALAKLAGEPLEETSASARKPGVYTLTIKAGGHRVAIRFAPDGAGVDSVEVEVG